ncbi:MAG: hypothetical protein IPO47_00140 [Bacteroidetes bacterium]|nr:hypothetical protein [Bacteroidota bacterium]
MNQALRILFSGYLIVLSCLYCNDKQTCAVSDTSVVAGSAGAHDDHEQDTENCSPFCICACCGQTAASTINLLAINSNLQSSTHYLMCTHRIFLLKSVYRYGNRLNWVK